MTYTLPSITYYARKLNELESRVDLLRCRDFKKYSDIEEINSLNEQISYYRNLMTDLQNSLKKLDVDELLNFIAGKMSIEIRKAHVNKIHILFSYVSDYAVEISVYNIFSTEISFSHKLYEKSWYPNKHYDAYHALCDEVYKAKGTYFLGIILTKLEKILRNEFPEIEINSYY